MIYMTSLRLFHTGIKALPSSIRYLINLEVLSINRCENFTDIPASIYELQKLREVVFQHCPDLVIFPNKVSQDDRHSLSGCSSSMDNLELPWEKLRVSECNISNIDFLASLNCAYRLSDMDLAGNPFVVLPECIKEFVNLTSLRLRGCSRLVEIPELPPRIKWLDVSNCVSLERISKLSNILERKETQMIEEMNLSNCWGLCQNLVEMANEEDDEVDVDLFCRLLSSQLSKFMIKFPVLRGEVPKWFSCKINYKGHRRFEFWIETLPNFKWDSTGLALCVAGPDQMLQGSSYSCFAFYIYIGEVRVSSGLQYVSSENMWLHYVPFHEILQFYCESYPRPLPPFTFRVVIYHPVIYLSDDCREPQALQSCGVHLVMPPNEDVCLQLIRAENLHSEISEDEKKV